MSIPAQYASTEELESFLGSPFAPGPFAFESAMAFDEREQLPEEALRLLDDWGLHRFYVPAALGGRLTSFEELASLTRAVSRRDLTLSIAHSKTMLGAVMTWVGGSRALQERMAGLIGGRHAIALALTERAHGSDLMATSTAATKTADGYSLTGEKWLINNATRSRAVTVLARTDERVGPRSLTLFVIDKDSLAEGAFEPLPKVRTLGIRGADISGLVLRDAITGGDSVVGAPGLGLELVLKGLFVTRTLTANLSVGAGDTALRVTLDFARARALYRGTVFDLPNVRTALVNGFVSLLVGECASICGSRAIHFVPEELGIVSAVAKHFIPTSMEALLQRLAVVLGARHYLREGHASGIFQKMLRDNALTSLFDGSTAVNLSGIGLQLRELLRQRRSTTALALFDVHAQPPPFALERIEPISRGNDTILSTGATIAARLAESGPELLGDCARRLVALLAELEREVEALTSGSRRQLLESPRMFALAEMYCRLHVAAACLGFWEANRARGDEFLRDGDWLVLALAQLLLLEMDDVRFEAVVERVAGRLIDLHERDALFSLLPLQCVTRLSRGYV